MVKDHEDHASHLHPHQLRRKVRWQTASYGAAKAVSIKLLKPGGIQRNVAVVKAREEAGLSCHVGGTGTSRLVEAAQAHFISASPAVLVPSEIAEFEDLDGDLVKGFEVVDGIIEVPQGHGLGVSWTSELSGPSIVFIFRVLPAQCETAPLFTAGMRASSIKS